MLETLRQARAAPAAESDLKNIKRLTKGRVDYFYTVFFFLRCCAMCYRKRCSICGKLTYGGCGKHIEAVLGDVPQEQRCQGHETKDEDD